MWFLTGLDLDNGVNSAPYGYRQTRIDNFVMRSRYIYLELFCFRKMKLLTLMLVVANLTNAK